MSETIVIAGAGHAAGQVTHSVSSYTLGTMRKYACELYASLPEESGIATSWHRSGSFRVAYHDVEVDSANNLLLKIDMNN